LPRIHSTCGIQQALHEDQLNQHVSFVLTRSTNLAAPQPGSHPLAQCWLWRAGQCPPYTATCHRSVG
jgi:hypothetical protein